MSLDEVTNELDNMDVPYQTGERGLTGTPEVIIDVTSLSDSKARQVEYMCTSHECIVTKDSETWNVELL